MTLWRLRATVDDRPGFLSVLTASLALRAVNILSVQVLATGAGAVDDFLVEAPGAMTERDLVTAIERGRGRDPWVRRSHAKGLVDEPTRALTLAAKVVADPDALAEALHSLLGQCVVTWRPDPPSAPERFTGTRLELVHPAGGTLVVHRTAPPFTPTEYARAHALTQFAVAVPGKVGRTRCRSC